MRMIKSAALLSLIVLAAPVLLARNPPPQQGGSPRPIGCEALLDLPNVTITRAVARPAAGNTPAHCYIQGTLDARIRFHMQLPLPENWNGRLLNIGDGGKDGALNVADHRLAQGYAVANSNTGHDAGAEPRATFAHEDLASMIDFGHRAVHLTAVVSKTIVRAFYGRNATRTYFEGCSTGGRQGLMEAQRYPDDFDGIVAGAPVYDYQRLNVSHVWLAQRIFADNLAGNLAFDRDGDGTPESLTKVEMLKHAVLEKCDAADGIKDEVIDDPPSCRFDPAVDLEAHLCRGNTNADDCFTTKQIQVLQDIYRGPHDSKGVRVFRGMDRGSEYEWDRTMFPHRGNGMVPAKLIYGVDHINFLFYEKSPGVPLPNPFNPNQTPDKRANPPEFGWWEFDIDDVTAGKGAAMMAITDATDPDLSRYLVRKNAKLLLFHGWADAEVSGEPTVDYYRNVIETTFKGDVSAARARTRLFLFPGMGHCGGGPGCNEFDALAALVDWVEKGVAPDYLVAQHRTNDVVDNQRRVCAWPQRAVYAGPAGGASDRANWVERNFTCK
ncbi:MAG: tannase/feruloyl esterase family alpha/beta hydrolase [Acidimicrobiia bacterium]|nr:tannase/feruloyl esterase family alpha/beta hydrolase [Acidimicrobiia bacterium]